jgi:hypothetical protein
VHRPLGRARALTRPSRGRGTPTVPPLSPDGDLLTQFRSPHRSRAPAALARLSHATTNRAGAGVSGAMVGSDIVPFAKTAALNGRAIERSTGGTALRPDAVRSAAWGISVRPSPFAALESDWPQIRELRIQNATDNPSHAEQQCAPLSEWTRTPGACEGDAVKHPTRRVSRQSRQQQVDRSQ